MHGTLGAETLSNVAVASVETTWLLTARPTSAFAPIVNVSLPTSVHPTPSADTYALIVAPMRSSFTQYGAATSGPVVLALVPPPTVRRWNALPWPADRSMNACAAPGSIVSRIITPALVHAFTFCTVATRAIITPSPFNGRYAYCSASAVPHTSAPAPFTVNVDEGQSYVVDPSFPVAPTS